ncbi:MAG: electron transport complex subunit RsxA [Erysipelotrichaceae bacterium]|nr:electron transport complex subunit RsxA [Erysipelotrichaceae bacterium]
MSSIIAIVIGCLFVSNIILSSFLGICPFLGISKKPSNAIGMGLALIFVVTLSSIICYCIERFILAPLSLDYLQLIVFILVIASFVQFVEFFMKKYMKSLYKALGIYLPLITTNCVVLFVAQEVSKYATTKAGLVFNYTFGNMLVYSIATAVGYMLVITLFSFIRVRIDSQDTPRPFKGNAIALITTALMALAFSAFVGLV